MGSFLVIEFEEGGLAVVQSHWVTPRKKEVYWPPVKNRSTFAKLLQADEPADINDSWKLYPIQKIFYETGI